MIPKPNSSVGVVSPTCEASYSSYSFKAGKSKIDSSTDTVGDGNCSLNGVGGVKVVLPAAAEAATADDGGV